MLPSSKEMRANLLRNTEHLRTYKVTTHSSILLSTRQIKHRLHLLVRIINSVPKFSKPRTREKRKEGWKNLRSPCEVQAQAPQPHQTVTIGPRTEKREAQEPGKIQIYRFKALAISTMMMLTSK